MTDSRALLAKTAAYRAGIVARRSGEPEPRSPYESGTIEYEHFARGFLLDPFPQRVLDDVGKLTRKTA